MQKIMPYLTDLFNLSHITLTTNPVIHRSERPLNFDEVSSFCPIVVSIFMTDSRATSCHWFLCGFQEGNATNANHLPHVSPIDSTTHSVRRGERHRLGKQRHTLDHRLDVAQRTDSGAERRCPRQVPYPFHICRYMDSVY